ncbi:hypothetical protein HK097_000011 [Rhizophlyctis rosea]|uniref:SCP2 domain-containing protein n=1 Tax=Rhizophlyctis rosea TaxID=64517 RepID=A0AAD5SLW0_9FUNG|nr:hypothetical protein HK097_000011 [Rhizophlyctis rosea]
MFKNITSDITGSSDICHVLTAAQFSEEPSLSFLLPNETPFVVFKSTKETHIFTDLAYISIKGQSATNTRRFIDRHEYYESHITNICFETAGIGATDRDVELKFNVGVSGTVSIDIWKKEIDVAKEFYKRILKLSHAQARNRNLMTSAENALQKLTFNLSSDPAASIMSSTDHLKSRLAEFQPQRPTKPSNAEILFPEIAKELTSNPSLTRNLNGLFIVGVKKGGRKDEWYLLFKPNQPPTISRTRPDLSSSNATFPIVILETTDADLLNIITGGLSGIEAFTRNRVKIVGDMMLATQLEEVFNKAGGVTKVMEYLRRAKGNTSTAAKPKL